MIGTLATILCFQLVGEVASRALDLPLPGPVVGLVLLVAACLARPALADRIRPATLGLLQHLSLFFVPAGVGIVAHWDLLRQHGVGLALALAGSTLLAIAAGAWVFQAVARRTGAEDPTALKDEGAGG
ncbi:CidA/LrgA family protein [Paracoccus spongiarum]|uniref:CidA/LrgA family protein n=1 Tax=Paracoccus spongiarum TaxID=3064387 RepID=A0ABT9JES7_9RHOB|nr:CidA/LrgA family protein [Paracoccus sp. 2205BS29-5]MDP5308323.1 CidA/LrgA family protein [Paracoccus sp. 2205BS29-5]